MDRRVLARTAALSALVAVSCGGGGDGGGDPDGVARLATDAPTLSLRPFDTGAIAFQLVDERGAPLPARVIQFGIDDDPTSASDDPLGATLRADHATTGPDGRASVAVIAGLAAHFTVRATAPRAAPLLVTVDVAQATHGAAEVVPALDDVDDPATVTTVRLYLFDGSACSGLRLDDLPKSLRMFRTIPVDLTAVFSSIAADVDNAVVALAFDGANLLQGGGCVDLAGSALLLPVTVRVVVPIHAIRTTPEGRWTATSKLDLKIGTDLVQSRWNELSLCGPGVDPARLWLDCVVDALKTDDATDPLDCRPGMDEGPLGAKLQARRGTVLPGFGGLCRGEVDAMGRKSHDALVAGLFPKGTSTLIDGLPKLPKEAAGLLSSVQLRSTLAITRTATRDRYDVEHRLDWVDFPLAATATSIAMAEMAPPVTVTGTVGTTIRQGQLVIGAHWFTVRLGTAARLAFGRASLRTRGAPEDIPGFVNAVLALASATDRSKMTAVSGCAAMDLQLSADVGEPRGCLMSACAQGVAALAAHLAAPFPAFDGEDLDLSLAGTVPLVDVDGDRRADTLGRAGDDPADKGTWMGELRARSGTTPFTGSWTAEPAR